MQAQLKDILEDLISPSTSLVDIRNIVTSLEDFVEEARECARDEGHEEGYQSGHDDGWDECDRQHGGEE